MNRSRHLFTDRRGGVSTGIYESLNFRMNSEDPPENVRENFRRLGEKLGCARLVLSRQEHTDTILQVDGSYVRADVYDPAPYVADGLVTREENLGLVIFTADCVSILLAGDGVVAAVHAGWRGTALGIAAKAVGEMGCDPASIRAWIGPAIGPCCYEVGDEVRAALLSRMGEAARPFFHGRNVDLQGLNRRQLENCGVGRVEVSPVCTRCSHEVYWSHRYTQGRRGVQAAAIVLCGQ